MPAQGIVSVQLSIFKTGAGRLRQGLVACLGAGLLSCGPAGDLEQLPEHEPSAQTESGESIPPTPVRRGTESPNNLLLITLDTTRIDRLGSYGYPKESTPHLDALAERGTRFDNAIAPLALTRPSHATMLTGLLPHGHGVWSNGPYRLEVQDNRQVQKFRDAGFQTGAVVASFVLSRSFGLNHGFELFDDRTEEIVGGDPEKTAEQVIAAATSWIEGPAGPPFLLWLHFYDPHHPYSPPEPFRSRFAEDLYDGEIAYMDHEIGRFLTHLEQRGWLADTLVVVVADHGEGLGEHGETTHGYFVYDNTVRVPMILAGPGVPVGLTVTEQITLADLMPTFLEAFGLALDTEELHGRSFWSDLQGGVIESRPAIVENRSLRNQFGWAALAGVRTNEWKWIRAPQPELYDLHADPAETRNLVDERPDQAHEMARLWNATRPPDRQRKESGLTPEEVEQLRSLGYLASGPSSSQVPESDIDPKSVAAAIPEIEDLIDARRSNRSSDTEASVDRILAVDPTNLFALRIKGEQLILDRDFARAVEILEPVVEDADAHPEAMAHLASAYDGLGRVADAVRWYERATSPPWIYWPALESLARLGARPASGVPPERVLRRLGDLIPSSAKESLSLARGFAILGQYPTAQTWFVRALELDPDMTEAKVGLGQMQARQGELEGALRTLSGITIQTVESAFVRGSVLAASGRRGEACQEFLEASGMDPRNANLLLGLGRGLKACGHLEPAARALETVLQTPPPNPVALFELAQLEEDRGDLERARKLYREFLQIAPEQMSSQKSHAAAILAR